MRCYINLKDFYKRFQICILTALVAPVLKIVNITARVIYPEDFVTGYEKYKPSYVRSEVASEYFLHNYVFAISQ